MQLGFVSAILPDLSLEEVAAFGASEGYSCVELMCWPAGKAERRYAGITHVDVADFTEEDAAKTLETISASGVGISGLGYYPNALAPDLEEARVAVEHIKKVIIAAKLLGVNQMNTFIGRDWKLSVDDNWPRFLETWTPIIAFAEEQGVRIGIENCAMLFTSDEWPGGKNLAHSPAIWRRMFDAIPSPNFGLNYDPSHPAWMHMDYLKPLTEFKERIFHVHAKDVLIHQDQLDDVGILATPLEFHSPVIPGRGVVDWAKFVATLEETHYVGPVCVEVEDRDFEATLELRKEALRLSYRHLKPLIG